ncbi:hypothetical protein PVAP13_9NG715828 [Panicum virgatum]|uniref:Uncharacterized protein n=1 Tax=Panicum virgatum TaxID=38727 RepID=A0A8T0MWL8_PANVG|nr:hypothetical protein PVAP13_9NG715828 [Panicum virgatum]
MDGGDESCRGRWLGCLGTRKAVAARRVTANTVVADVASCGWAFGQGVDGALCCAPVRERDEMMRSQVKDIWGGRPQEFENDCAGWGLPALSRWSGENRLACSIARHVMCRLPSGTRATLVALHPHQPLPPGRFESSREI